MLALKIFLNYYYFICLFIVFCGLIFLYSPGYPETYYVDQVASNHTMWPQTHRSKCLFLLSDGIKDREHHAQPKLLLFYVVCMSVLPVCNVHGSQETALGCLGLEL